MKKINFTLLFTIATLLFVSCEKEVESSSKSLQENLLDAKYWQATKFIINGENTMSPDNSDILDQPVSSLKIIFKDANALTMQIVMADLEGNRIDDSGIMPMSYHLNSADSTLLVSDENGWTAAASFTGNHKINSFKADEIVLTGKMGAEFNYQLYLSRMRK